MNVIIKNGAQNNLLLSCGVNEEIIKLKINIHLNLSLHVEKNDVDNFLSDTTQSHLLTNLPDNKERLEEQKSWKYPEKSKQMIGPQGQEMDRLFSESSVPKYEQVSIFEFVFSIYFQSYIT